MYQNLQILSSLECLPLNTNVICNAIRKGLFKFLTIYFAGTDNSNKFFSFDSIAMNIDFHANTMGTFACMKRPPENQLSHFYSHSV